MLKLLKNNIKLDEADAKELFYLCEKAGYKIDSKVSFVINKSLSWKRKCAVFSFWFRHTIYLCHDNKYLPDLVQKVCHEAEHRRQFLTHPILFLVAYGSIIGRYIWHEPQARKTERDATKNLSEYYNSLNKKR